MEQTAKHFLIAVAANIAAMLLIAFVLKKMQEMEGKKPCSCGAASPQQPTNLESSPMTGANGFF